MSDIERMNLLSNQIEENLSTDMLNVLNQHGVDGDVSLLEELVEAAMHRIERLIIDKVVAESVESVLLAQQEGEKP